MSTIPILLVDDDAHVLNSLTRTLNEEGFDNILISQDGPGALEIAKNTADLSLIISDFHMPGMNGIELLVQVQKDFPDVTRILLTGAADLGMSLDAINKGSVFRFLLKPCSPETLLAAVSDGLRQNELIKAERALLNDTLSGSVKVLVDILSVFSPGIFAQASRLRTLAQKLAVAMHLDDLAWEFELAALLSQIGAVTIPPETIEKWQKGKALDDKEARMIQSIPSIGKVLINNIPRLENIAEAVGFQDFPYQNPDGVVVPLTARVIKVIIDFDRLIEKTHNPEIAFHFMHNHESEYDPEILNEFETMVLRLYNQSTFKLSTHTMPVRDAAYEANVWEIFRLLVSHNYNLPADLRFPQPDNQPEVERPAIESSDELIELSANENKIEIDEIKTGMVLSRNINDKNGTLIVSRGTIITDVLKYRLINYLHSQQNDDPIFIEKIISDLITSNTSFD